MEFNEALGITIRADVTHPYDQFGTTVRKVGPVLPEMMDTIEAFLRDLQQLSARKVEALTLCSVWRPAKEGERRNRHAEGKAIDIGGVWWDRRDGITAWGYGAQRKQAVAFEAVQRIHFGTCLGPTSNQQHANHWHDDIGKEPGITPSELAASQRRERKVEVVFVQDACSTVHGIPLKLDGWWGDLTEAAVNQVLRGLDGVDLDLDITIPMTYKAFCVATALVGFGVLEAPTGDSAPAPGEPG
jgi:hypothetical protein